MKKNFWVLSLFLFLSWAGWTIWWSQQGERGGKLAAYFGIMAHAYQVKEMENGENQTLSYWVSLSFPSDDAYRFYDKALKKKGWIPVQWKGMGEQDAWSSSLAKTPDTHRMMITYKYFSVWVNDKRDRMALLDLGYYDPAIGSQIPPAPQSTEMLVTIQEMPYRIP